MPPRAAGAPALEYGAEDSSPCCEGCNGRPWGVPCQWVACGRCGEAPTLHCGRCCPLQSFGVLRGQSDGGDTRRGRREPSASASWLGDSGWDLRRRREVARSEGRWRESRSSDAELTQPPTCPAAMSFSVPVGTSWVAFQQVEKRPTELARAREQPVLFPRVWELIRRLGREERPRHRLVPVQDVISAAAELFPPVPAAVVQAALEGLGSTGALRPGWAVDWGRLRDSRADHSRVASLQFLLARVVPPPRDQPPVERIGRRGLALEETAALRDSFEQQRNTAIITRNSSVAGLPQVFQPSRVTGELSRTNCGASSG